MTPKSVGRRSLLLFLVEVRFPFFQGCDHASSSITVVFTSIVELKRFLDKCVFKMISEFLLIESSHWPSRTRIA